MLPIIAALAANGLSILGNAILAKGKEVVEERLGVKIPNDPAGLTPELVQQLKVKEMEHEQFLVQAALEGEKVEQTAVTERWKADMSSDSWLSKNVRPLTLTYLTLAITIMAILPINVDRPWIELLKDAYLVVLTTYFVSRGVQHVYRMKNEPR